MSALRYFRKGGWQALLIIAAGWFVYSPVLRGNWLWDDNADITGNDLMDDPAGVRKIWFSPTSFDYYPVKASVQWLQWQAWGERTLGYHLTNLALHIFSALLFWKVLSKLGVRQGWLGGLLFVVHPMAVESVAWIAELKNTLSLPPFLLSIGLFLDFEKSRQRRYLWGSVGLFLIAMLCKSSMVMFPFAVLMFAWWKRGTISKRDFWASVPYLAISLALGLVAIWLQDHRAIGATVIPLGGLLSRLACAGLVWGLTLFHCVIPIGLIPIYPHWKIDPPNVVQFLPWVGAALLALCLWSKRKGWGRHALLGMGWFTLHLIPVLGLVAISYMRFTWVMDHLAYVSLLGVLGLAAAGAGAAYQRMAPSYRGISAALALFLCGLLAFASRAYATCFSSSEALWKYTLKRNPTAWIAHFNYGIVLNRSGRKTEAADQYREAVRLRPDYPEALNNLGALLSDGGHPDQALAPLTRAVELQRDFVDAEDNLGKALRKLGRPQEALPHLERAAGMDPAYIDARISLSDDYLMLGRDHDALVQGQKAVELDPDVAAAHNSLGMALRVNGQVPQAISEFRKATALDPNIASFHQNLATALMMSGQLPAAIEEYEVTLRLEPRSANSETNLGFALTKSGKVDQAVVHFKKALAMDPNLYEAHLNLGYALQALGRKEEAKGEFVEAARLEKERGGLGR